MTVVLISWAFPLVVVAYMVLLVSFMTVIRREHRDYWKSIGSPGLWEPNGQVEILKRVFLPSRLPAQIAGRHRLLLNSIRMLAVLGLVLFFSILLMIWLGMFDQ